jgi:DNA-binding NtrC family response regulator
MDKVKALVVDDEPTVCEAVKAILETESIVSDTATDPLKALELAKKNRYDLVISDLKMPRMDGLQLFEKISEIDPDGIFIIITAYGTIASAVEAIKRGIYDYIPKPFTPDEVRIPVKRALEKKRLERENVALRTQIEARYSFQSIIGASAPMHELFRVMRHAASGESNVLITGESGTGKELAARAIHSNSVRARRKFIIVNCGAIPEGLLESELFGHMKGAFTGAVADKKGLLEEADKGTLFLDEIGELAPTLQVKLLRVLQEGEFMRLGETQSRRVNIRLIAATNRNLKKMIAERKFREDLFYRLNVIPIEIPPLRERKEDIPLLVTTFIEKHRAKAGEKGKTITGLSREAMETLFSYNFAGNVRELENAIEYSMAFTAGPLIQRSDLPAYILEDKKPGADKQPVSILPLREAKSQFEKNLITAALIEANGNISEAARILNIHRQNLQQKIRLLGIDLSSITLSSQ